MCVTFANLGSRGSTVRKSEFTGSTFVQPARDTIIVRVPKRLRSRSKAYNCYGISLSAERETVRTLPILRISALRCVVLLPGAAVASITTTSLWAGGARTTAGKHEALSWRMSLPDLYAGSSWNVVCGGKRIRFGMCWSFANALLWNHQLAGFIKTRKFARGIKRGAEREALRSKILHSICERPQSGVDPDIARNLGCTKHSSMPRTNGNGNNEPARASPDCTSSALELTPRLILSFWNSP